MPFAAQTSSTNHKKNFEKREESANPKQDHIEDRISLIFIPEPGKRTGKTNEHGWVDGERVQRVVVEDKVVKHKPEEDDSWEAGENDGGCDVVIHLDGVVEDDSEVQERRICSPRSEQS